MFTTALKGVLAHKTRLVLTATAIVLGVAFVAGSLVFTDTIQARFDTLFADVYAGTDASVRATADADALGGAANGVVDRGLTVPASLAAEIEALPEADAAEGYLQTFGQVIDPAGNPVGGMGPPTYVYSWVDDPRLNPFVVGEGDGREPMDAGELVLDVATAELAGYEVGDTVEIQFAAGTEPFELVGVASFGDSNNLAGATISVVTGADLRRITGLDDEVTFIDVVAAEGTDEEALVAAMEPLLPVGAEAVTGTQQTGEAIDGFTDGLGFLSYALLGFAAVAVFVGAFIIHNTFRIVVAQRTKELALMRAVGASSGQVTGMVLVEALAVGLVASALGILAGIGFAEGIKAAMDAVGFGIPDGPLTVAPRTIVVALVVGLVVTAVSALRPARAAARVAPVEAMSATTARQEPMSTRAVQLRIAVGGVGVAFVVSGLVAGVPVLAGTGAAVLAIAVILLAPALAGPLARVVGRPLPGLAGRLARENTARDPRRTASTASALTIGVALVVFTAIFAASIKTSIGENLDAAFPADLTVRSTNLFLGVSPEAIDDLGAAEDVEVFSAVRVGPALVDGEPTMVAAVDGATAGAVYDPGATIPLADLGAGISVEATTAETAGLEVGDTVEVALSPDESARLEVVATHTDTNAGAWLVDESTWETLGGGDEAALVLVSLADGVELVDGQAAVEDALAAFPSLLVDTKSDQIATAEAQVDSFLVLFTALLGLALLIAVLGIANTLALSIVERTREIGLLRAVGMGRRQVRRMITGEAVVTAVFGATVGAGLGLGLGWVVVTAFADEGLGTFAFPAAQVVTWLVVAALAGVVAAILPARTASRLDVLDAIAWE